MADSLQPKPSEGTSTQEATRPLTQPANVFVCYRRHDTGGRAGRLFDNLKAHLPGRVFMDLDRDSIAPGVSYIDAIEEALGSCQVLIAVIGRQWLTVTDKHGRRRIDDPDDELRLELTRALKRKIRVIPVLVDSAELPTEEERPHGLEMLWPLQSIHVSDDGWHADLVPLLQAIDGLLPQPVPPTSVEPETPPALPPPRWRNLIHWVGKVMGLCLAAAPLLLASLIPFPIARAIPVSAVGLGVLAAALSSFAAERGSTRVVRRRLRYSLVAVVAGLISVFVLKESFTMPVRVGSTWINVLIGPGAPREPLAGCPCEKLEAECFRRHPHVDRVKACWGDLALGRVLFDSAYLILTVGWGGVIGLIGMPRRAPAAMRKAPPRRSRPRTSKAVGSLPT